MRGYDGPTLPDDQVALVETDSTRIYSVDGKVLKANTVEVRSGERVLEITLSEFGSDYRGLTYSWSGPLPICLIARPRHTYLVRPARFQGVWGPEIIDTNTTQRVAIRGPDDPSGCPGGR
jgi:hypothetical protein